MNGKKATRLCPCGHHGNPERECRCTPDRIRSYQQRISGPLLDRIDLHIKVPVLQRRDHVALLNPSPQDNKNHGLDSTTMRNKVAQCRSLQLQRGRVLNARMEQAQVGRFCTLAEEDRQLLAAAMHKLRLSPRACMRILKVARTIADLDGKDMIATAHLLEAVSYRQV